MNRAVIELGSNIDPEINIQKAIFLLKEHFGYIQQSKVLITKPVGFSDQPDFYNCAILIETELGQDKLKEELNLFELEMGRIKTDNKYGPRKIDFDIIIWNSNVVNRDFYDRTFVRENILDLIPDLKF